MANMTECALKSSVDLLNQPITPSQSTSYRSVLDFPCEDALREALRCGVTHELPSFVSPEADLDDFQWTIPTKIDPSTTEAQTVEEELDRLTCLKSYCLLDADREEVFDRLARLGKRTFRVPFCNVSLMDFSRQWVVACEGTDQREYERKITMCSHTVQLKKNLKSLVINDATEDFRFCENPFVQAGAVRFYAGAPLISPEGYQIGSFCIFDPVPRPNGLSAKEEATLLDFAWLATQEMVRYRDAKRAMVPESLIISTSHELRTPLGALQLALTLLVEDETLMGHLDAKHRGVLVNAKQTSDLLGQLCEHSIDMLRNDPRHRGLSVTSIYALHEQISLIATLLARNGRVKIVLDQQLPEYILSNEISLLQLALNLIEHGLIRSNNTTLEMRLLRKDVTETTHKLHDELVFECHFCESDVLDTSADVDFEDHLGLQSLEYWTNVLSGHCGHTHTGDGNIVFYSCVPLFKTTDKGSKVDSMNHHIELCRSTPLPTEMSIHHGKEQESIHSIPTTDQSSEKCALVIEDCLVVRKTIIRALKSLGYTTREAKDGLEGLKCLKDNVYDVVLCDFLMPVMDGLDCMKQYREWESKERPSPRQYIVGMSAHVGTEASNQGIEAGMDDFRPKPISIQTLEEILESDRVKSKAIARCIQL